MSTPFEEFRALRKTNAYMYEIRLRVLSDNFYIFDTNHSELKRLLDISDDTKLVLEILDNSKPKNLDYALLELMRRLQNFVLSALSLRDVTKILIEDWYASEPFYVQYKDKEKNHFKGKLIHNFIADFRHYLAHKGRPSVYSKWSFQKEPNALNQMFNIPKEYLLEDFEWKGEAKAFLDSLPSEIDIRHLVEDYFAEIRDFHTWLFEAIKLIHKDDLEWLVAEKKRLSDLMG